MSLQSFVVTRAFNKLFARLHVDCWLKEASVTISFDRRIRRIEVVPFHDVADPAMAEAWFSKSASVEHGSWLEFHAMMCARDPQWLVPEEPLGGSNCTHNKRKV